jgi:hypothetical protein
MVRQDKSFALDQGEMGSSTHELGQLRMGQPYQTLNGRQHKSPHVKQGKNLQTKRIGVWEKGHRNQDRTTAATMSENP